MKVRVYEDSVLANMFSEAADIDKTTFYQQVIEVDDHIWEIYKKAVSIAGRIEEAMSDEAYKQKAGE